MTIITEPGNDIGKTIIEESTRGRRSPITFQERVIVPVVEALKVKAAIRNGNVLRVARRRATQS